MSTAQSNILVPIDFSKQSLIALGQSYNLARLSQSDIHLLYVIESEGSALTKIIGKKKNKTEDDTLKKSIRSKLQEIAVEAKKKSGAHIHTHVEKGKVYEQIVKIAEKLNAMFIIMGTNDGSSGKKFIGSNALRVVRESAIPVITIKNDTHRSGCKNIVLPLDLTKETKEKVMRSIEVAKYFGSTIRVITVITASDEFIVNKLKRQLAQVERYIESKNVHCTAESIIGDNVPKELVSYSKKVDADLIMIMTQQENNWTKFFISSAAQQIIDNTNVPVLSIRPTEKVDRTVFVPY